jgi:hypothetical protein
MGCQKCQKEPYGLVPRRDRSVTWQEFLLLEEEYAKVLPYSRFC